jgi:hypothetical protein
MNACQHEAGMVPNDAAGTWECELGCGYSVPPTHRYRVSVNVTADDATGAARMVGEALGFDQNSVHEIGGLSVDLLPDEKRFLVCRGCGEACDGIISATEHGVSDVSGCGGWCGEEGFDIVPESEAY